jgi:hypothetical protein
MSHFKVIVLSFLYISLISCFSIETKVEGGHLGGSSWYNPNSKALIYFKDNERVALSIFNDDPTGMYTSRLSRKEMYVTYDRNSQKGTIDNVAFEVKKQTYTNREQFYLIYDGVMYLLEKEYWEKYR